MGDVFDGVVSDRDEDDIDLGDWLIPRQLRPAGGALVMGQRADDLVPGPFGCDGDCPAGTTGTNDRESQWASRCDTWRGYLDGGSTFPEWPQDPDQSSRRGANLTNPLGPKTIRQTEPRHRGPRLTPNRGAGYSSCTWLGVITGQLESISFFRSR